MLYLSVHWGDLIEQINKNLSYTLKEHKGTIHTQGRNPFNQNFRAEVRKFLGGVRIATRTDALVPFHWQKEFPAVIEMEDVGSMFFVLELHDDFDPISGVVRAVSCVGIYPA